jgi:hypothetical protein
MFFLFSYISLNNASLEDLRRIFPPDIADSVYKYRQLRGEFESIYELRNIPGVTDEIFAKVVDSLVLNSPEEVDTVNLGGRISDVISQSTREESPSDLSREYWIFLGGNPINPNKASVYELMNIYGVSFKDALAVIKWREVTKINSLRDLRSAPGLSYFAYRNLRNFVAFREEFKPFRGFVSFYTLINNYPYDPSSFLASAINQLSDTGISSRNRNLLRQGGWSDESINKLIERLRLEYNDLKLEPRLGYSIRGIFRLYERFDFGFYRWENYRIYNKFFLGYNSQNLRVLVGDYRFSFGNGLIFESSENLGDRVYEKVIGLMPDVIYGNTFNLKGFGVWGNFFNFSPFLIYSRSKKDGLVDTAGRPLFYYSSEFVPRIYSKVIGERILGGGFNYINPLGFGFGVMYFQIEYDEPFSGDWGSLAIPYYSYTFNNGWQYDPSFKIDTSSRQRYLGFTYMGLLGDLEFRGDIAGNLENFKPSYLFIAKWSRGSKTVDVVYRNYSTSYSNPYARPFKEDNRFERTDFRYSYRVLDPLATNLADLPLPKPEEGIFFQVRDRLFQNIILPRVYLDYWRDKTDGQTNVRLHAEVEWRVLWSFRVRLWRRYLDRVDIRYGSPYLSRSTESAVRFFFITDASSIAGIEVRYSEFKAGTLNPSSGTFLSTFYEFPFASGTKINTGLATWTSSGPSLWIFEDDGIDFLYSRGSKVYISLSKAVSQNAYLRLKLRYKRQINDGNSLISATGEPINAGIGKYDYFNANFRLYITF